jgi:hypothetical protein
VIFQRRSYNANHSLGKKNKLSTLKAADARLCKYYIRD